MKKWILFSIALFNFTHHGLFAALPPLYESVRELQAILSDDKLGQVLSSGDLILEIKKTDAGFLIITNKHEVLARVISEPSKLMGPAQFKIVFEAPTPIE